MFERHCYIVLLSRSRTGLNCFSNNSLILFENHKTMRSKTIEANLN